MILVTCIYNLFLLAVDAIVLLRVKRRSMFGIWVTGCLAAGAAALAGAALLGRPAEPYPFGVARLAAYGLFLHGPILSTGGAVLLVRSHRKTAGLLGLLAVSLVAVAADAFLIEPTWLEVSHRRITSPKLTRPVRIAVVADFQCEELGRYERDALRRVLEEKPDLILLAGDYLQADRWTEDRLAAEINDYLRQLGFSAPWGVFAVRGNAESHGWTKIFAGLPIRVTDQTEGFDAGEFRVSCLAMGDSFRYRGLQLPPVDASRFHIVLGHSPNFALQKIDADLLVAGHTHGGQVCLPLFGPPVTNAQVPRRWASGMNQLPGGATLVVSRGIGMERGPAPRLRFLCRPELVIIDVEPES